MQPRITEAHLSTKSMVKPTNSPDIKKGDTSDSLVRFQRHITNQFTKIRIFTRLFNDTNLEDDDPLLEVLDNLATAVLAKAYKRGRCGEISAVLFIELLKSGINKSIELISSEGILHDRSEGNHQVVLLDHEIKDSLVETKSLSNVTVVDSWWKYEPKTFNGDLHPTREDLASNYIKKVTKEPQIIARFERNFTSKDCKNCIVFLLNFRQLLSYEFFVQMVKETGRKSVDIDAELLEIYNVISKEIAWFKFLSLHPPTAPKISLEGNSLFMRRAVSDQIKSETTAKEEKSFSRSLLNLFKQ